MLRSAAAALVLAAALPAAAQARGTVSLIPAAGPPGTVATLSGAGLPARSRVVVTTGGRVVARRTTNARGAFTTTLTLRGATGVGTRVGARTRARNRFRVGSALAGETVTPAGARLRWTPLQALAGTAIHLSGAGLRPRRAVALSLGGRVVATARTTRGGRFTVTLSARDGAGLVRQGSARLPFAVRLLAREGTPTKGSPPSAPAPAPGTTGPAAPGELGFPIRAAFYYPWFPQAWDQSGIKPFTHFHPTLGFYDSGATATITRHLDMLRYARIQVAISSWWGQGHYTDQRLPALLATTRAAGSPVRWAVYYEQEGFANPSVAQLATDLAYLRDRYADDPAYLRIGGRFVVFAYGGGDTCEMADRWRAANAGIGAYVVLKVVTGHRACAAQPDGWHQYAPANRTDSQRGESFSISPGFWLASDSAPRLGRDITCFRRAVRDMVASRAPWQLVTTFDEWGEGTSVEPAQEWDSTSGYGQDLDALHDDGAGPAAAAPC